MDLEIQYLVEELYSMHEYMTKILKKDVIYLIRNNVKDIKTIEIYLDQLLNIPTDKAQELFKELCRYYMTINKENAESYFEIYKEMYEENHKTKKRTK
jgi:hypothetical protein